VEKLPAEQKALAEQLQQKLDAMSAARQEYAKSMEAENVRLDEQQKELERQAAELTAKIDARKSELADQAARQSTAQQAKLSEMRKAQIEKKRAELVVAEEARKNAQAAYRAARDAFELADRQVADARRAGERMDQLAADRDTVFRDLQQKESSLQYKRGQLAQAVAPVPPDSTNVHVEPYDDPRAMYVGGASVAIVLVFSVMILMAIRESVPPPPMARPVSGNGEAPASEESANADVAHRNGEQEDEEAVMA
jgi:hypothetical protein